MRGRTCGRGLGRVYPIKKNPPVPLTGMSEFYTWGCEAPIQTEAYISHLIGSSSTAFDVKNRWRLNDRPSFGQEVRVPHSALLQLIIASAVVDDAVGARAVFIVSCAARKTRSPRDRRLERAVSSYHFFCDTKWLFMCFFVFYQPYAVTRYPRYHSAVNAKLMLRLTGKRNHCSMCSPRITEGAIQ